MSTNRQIEIVYGCEDNTHVLNYINAVINEAIFFLSPSLILLHEEEREGGERGGGKEADHSDASQPLPLLRPLGFNLQCCLDDDEDFNEVHFQKKYSIKQAYSFATEIKGNRAVHTFI